MNRMNPFVRFESEITGLLDRQCAAVRAGDYKSAATLGERIAESLEKIDASRLDPVDKAEAEAALARLRKAAERAGAVFQAAREGVATARRRIERIRSESVSTGAYGRTGERVDSTPSPSSQRRV